MPSLSQNKQIGNLGCAGPQGTCSSLQVPMRCRGSRSELKNHPGLAGHSPPAGTWFCPADTPITVVLYLWVLNISPALSRRAYFFL